MRLEDATSELVVGRRCCGVLASVLLASSTACAPVFQDARLVGKGQAEITPSVSPTFGTGGGNTEHLTNNFGVHGLVGLSDRADFGVGYGRVQIAGLGPGVGGVNVVAFGPKISLVRDRVALAIPLSFGFGSGADVSQSFELHPTAIFTAPVNPHVDVSPSIGALIPFCDGCGLDATLVRLNLGVGIRPRGGRAVVRPEFGVLLNPGEPGVIWTFGLGVSVRSKR
jgi:hypothetical protein